MKKLIYSALVASLALAVSVRAADENNPKKKARAAKKAATEQATSVETRGDVKTKARGNSNAMQAQQSASDSGRRIATMKRQNKTQSMEAPVAGRQGGNETAAQPKAAKNGLKISKVDQSRNTSLLRSVAGKSRKNVTVVNNWSGSRFSGPQYAPFRDYRRAIHDRGWYQSRYSRFALFGGGNYYWNNGYWYPAWGYNSGYRYGYDGPIYGYNNLNPDQVALNVQVQLQRAGYYSGPIDASLGPITRRALAYFQADRGLPITSGRSIGRRSQRWV